MFKEHPMEMLRTGGWGTFDLKPLSPIKWERKKLVF